MSSKASFCPEEGRCGPIDDLPISAWAAMDGRKSQKRAIRSIKRGTLTTESAKAILLNHGLPTSLKDRFLGPCLTDIGPPAEYQFIVPDDEHEYQFKYDSNEDMYDEATKRRAVLGMIAFSIHCYLGAFLARGEDAVKVLQYPGFKAWKLDEKERLMIGLMREVAILPHFADLRTFWFTLLRMRNAGCETVGYRNHNDLLTTPRVKELLAIDGEALAMFEVLLIMMGNPTTLSGLVLNCDWLCENDVNSPFHHTHDSCEYSIKRIS